MKVDLFLKGGNVVQADPLTQKARTIVARQLREAARRYVQQAQNQLEEHNHVDYYFGGLDQRLSLTSKALQRQFLKHLLRKRSLRERVATVRVLLKHRQEKWWYDQPAPVFDEPKLAAL